MPEISRRVFVISDLHLGGRAGVNGDRGFQMMTHPEVLAGFIRGLGRVKKFPVELVIAGDFVDFLAEDGEVPGVWTPLIDDSKRALALFVAIATDSSRRVAPVFTALAELLAAGHRLTVMLGNHDVELSYPVVRRELARVLGVAPGAFQFIYDGEAYRIGDALIEHGNRYDPFNIVDHDGMRHRRSLQSRGQEDARDDGVKPPAGSRVVAEIMNPVKARYAFVDLLKPETEAVFPLLLALEPTLRWKLPALLHAAASSLFQPRGALRGDADMPLRLRDAGARARGLPLDLDGPASRAAAADPLREALAMSLGEGEADRFLAEIEDATIDPRGESDELSAPIRDASAARPRGAFSAGMWDLLTARTSKPIEARLPALHRALRVLQKIDTFQTDVEHETAYLDAARALCDRGDTRVVVFGHTHLARQVDLGDGRTYINTGTWANLLRVPTAVLDDTESSVNALRTWVEDVKENRLEIWFRPTCARIDFDAAERVIDAQLLPVGDPEHVDK